MTRVVICAQHGGFGLSMAGESAYLARKGKQAFFYANPRNLSGRCDYDHYVRAETQERPFVVFTFTEDLGDEPTAREMDDSKAWFTERDIPRDDPDLIAVIEELGDAASGSHCRFSIVEIPDSVEWEIEEYDGLEWVAEKHRVWS